MKVENFLVVMLGAFMAAWLWIPTGGYGYDVSSFQTWTVFIHQHGLRHAYELKSLDYNPLFIQLLWLFGWLEEPAARINSTFFAFKLFVLLFDFAGVYLAAYLLKRHRREIALAFLILFNVAYVYNTLFWGQADAIHTFFIALSVFFANRRRVTLSLLAALISINFKLIALSFAPLIVLLNVPEIRRDWRPVLRALVIGLALQVLIVFPFLSAGQLAGMKAAFEAQMRATSTLTPSGMNFWNIIYGAPAAVTSAKIGILHIKASAWGTVLFFLAAGVSLWPLFRTTILEKKRLSDDYVFLASALYGLAFFFFKTGMHERYGHPVILLSGIAAVLSGRYVLYVLASLSYFLNLEKSSSYFALHTYETVIFHPAFVAGLFLVVLVVGTIQMYRDARASALAAV
jgi:hypothetical protein